MRLLLSFLLLAGFAFGQEPEIRAAERAWSKAVVAKDTASLQKMFGDQLIYAHSTGVMDTKSSYISKLTSGKQKYDGIDLQNTTVKMYGNTAVTHSRVRMWGTNQDGKFDDQLAMLHVWVKNGGAWQLVAHQTARLK
jgi:ketosteroid isomerase-like protein